MDRAEVSRRLKAGRWLAGGVDEKGKATALSVRELAERAPLKENGISVNRLEEFEQGRVDARPMELERIGEALGLPMLFSNVREHPGRDGVVAELLDQVTQVRAGLAALAAGTLLTQPGQPAPGETGHPSEHQPGAG